MGVFDFDLVCCWTPSCLISVVVVAIIYDSGGDKDHFTFFGCVFDIQMRTALEWNHIFLFWLFLLFFARFFFLSKIAG
jgi:hypothetical protein